MNVLHTFELFKKEAISVIKERVVQFFLYETNSLADNRCMYTHILKKGKTDITQISIINNKKVYNLLSCAWARHEKKIKNENINC